MRKSLESARQHLEEEASTIRQIIRRSSTVKQSDLQLQSVQVRLSAIQFRLRMPLEPASRAKVSSVLSLLADAANEPQATASDLNNATSAFLVVRPSSLRCPDLASHWDERSAVFTHRRCPTFLLLLALTYQANGKPRDAAQTALEGLSQLPAAAERAGETPLINMLLSVAAPHR